MAASSSAPTPAPIRTTTRSTGFQGAAQQAVASAGQLYNVSNVTPRPGAEARRSAELRFNSALGQYLRNQIPHWAEELVAATDNLAQCLPDPREPRREGGCLAPEDVSAYGVLRLVTPGGLNRLRGKPLGYLLDLAEFCGRLVGHARHARTADDTFQVVRERIVELEVLTPKELEIFNGKLCKKYICEDARAEEVFLSSEDLRRLWQLIKSNGAATPPFGKQRQPIERLARRLESSRTRVLAGGHGGTNGSGGIHGAFPVRFDSILQPEISQAEIARMFADLVRKALLPAKAESSF
jgi:hypothetical protein